MRNVQVFEETITYTRVTVGPRHYYFNPSVDLEDIGDWMYRRTKTFEKKASVIYNYELNKFEKCDWEDIDYLNGVSG